MKYLLIVLLFIFVGCTTTGKAYLPYTSHTYHVKKSCPNNYDANPIVMPIESARRNIDLSACLTCSSYGKKPRATSISYDVTKSLLEAAVGTGNYMSQRNRYNRTNWDDFNRNLELQHQSFIMQQQLMNQQEQMRQQQFDRLNDKSQYPYLYPQY